MLLVCFLSLCPCGVLTDSAGNTNAYLVGWLSSATLIQSILLQRQRNYSRRRSPEKHFIRKPGSRVKSSSRPRPTNQPLHSTLRYMLLNKILLCCSGPSKSADRQTDSLTGRPQLICSWSIKRYLKFPTFRLRELLNGSFHRQVGFFSSSFCFSISIL